MPSNITSFLTRPDGSADMIERFSEMTFVETAELSKTDRPPELRRPGRARPRYELEGTFILVRDERFDLTPLQAGQEVLVPAWMHKLQTAANNTVAFTPAVIKTAVEQPFVVMLVDGTYQLHYSDVVSNGSRGRLLDWNPEFVEGWPAVKARMTDDSLTYTHVTPTIFTTNLAFESDDSQEPLVPFGLSTKILGTVSFARFLDGTQNFQTNVEHNANRFDNGNVRTWELRHSKRYLTMLLTALNYTEALQLRTTLLNMRGRFRSFPMVDPRDGLLKRFRLATDVLEFRWINSSKMRITLKLVEVLE